MARRQPDPAGGLHQHPRAVAAGLLHGDPGDAGLGSIPVRRSGEELGARSPRPDPPHDDGQRHTSLRRLPRRRLHAHPAPGPGRRADALDDLLRVPRPARRDDGPRDRPSVAGEHEVPARPHLPGVRRGGRRRRSRLRRWPGVGHRSALRAAPLPHPDQDQARARRDPRRAPVDRPDRLRGGDVPHRPRLGDSVRRRHRIRGVELRRLPAERARRRVVGVDARDVAPVVVDRPRRAVRRLPCDPAADDAPPHVHVAVEHVPPRSRPPEGRDEADAQPRRDRAGDVRRVGGRGLHVEAAPRHRRLHDVRPVHRGVPGPRNRQAARPARDRAQDGRGDGGHRGPGRAPAARHRRRDHGQRATPCSSASRRRSSGPARRAGPATRRAR